MLNMFEDRARQVQREYPMRVMLQRESNWATVTLRPETIPGLQPVILAPRDGVAAALAAHPHRIDLEKICVASAPLLRRSLALTCRGIAPLGQ
jgi:hypothetical protein